MEDFRIAVSKRVRRNEEIDAIEVRVIDSEGQQRGVLPIREAIQVAKDEGLDLVEVSPMADPPVCRIMDFGKYLFEQNKKSQAAKRKQKQVHVKEIKFRPGTEEGDYQIKLRKLVEFLTDGDKTIEHGYYMLTVIPEDLDASFEKGRAAAFGTGQGLWIRPPYQPRSRGCGSHGDGGHQRHRR